VAAMRVARPIRRSDGLAVTSSCRPSVGSKGSGVAGRGAAGFMDRLTRSATERWWFANHIHLEHPDYPSVRQGSRRAGGPGSARSVRRDSEPDGDRGRSMLARTDLRIRLDERRRVENLEATDAAFRPPFDAKTTGFILRPRFAAGASRSTKRAAGGNRCSEKPARPRLSSR
jgi:hypothetical protein